MNESRRRKYPDGRKNDRKRVTFHDSVDDASKSRPFNPRDFILSHKYKLMLFFVCLAVVYLVFAPPPKFSKEVQFWHDSSYAFEFLHHEILYQDIRRLTKPVKDAPVLLILHGFPTSSYDWKDLVPDLQKTFPRIVIPDFLGFGFSDKPFAHQYSIKEQADMIEELMVHMKLADVHVLAHDYGDTVLQELIAKSLDPTYHLMFRIRSACLSNGGIIPSQHKPLTMQKLLTIPVIGTALSFLSNKYIYASRLASVFSPATRPSSKQLDEMWSILLYKRGHASTPAILTYIAERHANQDRWVGALQNTDVPLHLIYGPLDPINTPDGFLKSYRDLVSHSSVSVLENIGHYPQMEDAKGFINAYNTFLKRVTDEHYVL